MSVPTVVRSRVDSAESVGSDPETAASVVRETDAALVRRFVRRRDGEAFAELHRRHEGLIRGVCARLLSHPEDREDAYQATFMTFLLRADTIRRRGSTACWLYGVAYRVSLRLRRRRKREPIELAHEPSIDPPEAWELLHRRHLCETLDAEMQELPVQERLPLTLHYLMGRSHREVGEELGLSPAAVDGRIKRARQRLRLRLSARGIGLSTALAFFGACWRDAQASAAAGSAASIDAFVAGDVAVSPFSSTAQGLFTEDRTMIAMGWTRNLAAAGGVALACCGVAGVFWGGAGGPTSTAQAQMGGGGFGGGGLGGGYDPGPPGPIVTVRLVGDQPEQDPARFFKPLSENPALLERLQDPVQLDFLEQPLELVIDAMAMQLGIEVQFNTSQLESEGLQEERLVTIASNSMTVAEALDTLLAPYELTYVVKERYVLVTNRPRASEMTETRMYAISDHPLLRGANAGHLVQAIQDHVAPGNWQEGLGNVSLLPGALIVTSDQRTLEKVEAFLNQYGRLLAAYEPAQEGAMSGMDGGGMIGGYGGMPGMGGAYGGGGYGLAPGTGLPAGAGREVLGAAAAPDGSETGAPSDAPPGAGDATNEVGPPSGAPGATPGRSGAPPAGGGGFF